MLALPQNGTTQPMFRGEIVAREQKESPPGARQALAIQALLA